ncbi:MAG TPA: hypothetical protein VM848_04715 [Acidimicrobiia bacterium]|nr:hypothetical protein [Acidimicrobiia bacterium]
MTTRGIRRLLLTVLAASVTEAGDLHRDPKRCGLPPGSLAAHLNPTGARTP